MKHIYPMDKGWRMRGKEMYPRYVEVRNLRGRTLRRWSERRYRVSGISGYYYESTADEMPTTLPDRYYEKYGRYCPVFF